MRLDKPTNPKAYARLLVKSIFSIVRETRRALSRAEYEALADDLGLSNSQLSQAIRELQRDSLISLEDTTRAFKLTARGVQEGDYWTTHALKILHNDPLPESLDEVRKEIDYFANEQLTTHPHTSEWDWAGKRLTLLQHKENVMVREASTAVYILSGAGARVNVNSADNSVNTISISEADVFPKLRSEIEAKVTDSLRRQQIIEKLGELEQSKGSSSYAAKFRDFVSFAADIMTIIYPFIQPLSALIR